MEVDALAMRSIRIPAEDREHDKKADHIRDRDMPAVPQPRPTDLASAYMLASATPAEDPNQIIEPPKPTA